MADIDGTNGDDNLPGNAQGEGDIINGGRGDDVLNGYSGDDYLIGGRGSDILIGGAGSDVLLGGPDGDIFRWSAGHIQNGSIDWVRDFSFGQNPALADSLQFWDSANGQTIELLSVTRGLVQNTSSGEYDFANSQHGTDLIFTVRNSVTMAEQRIVLIDAWSNALSTTWNNYLQASFGYTGGIADVGTVNLA